MRPDRPDASGYHSDPSFPHKRRRRRLHNDREPPFPGSDHHSTSFHSFLPLPLTLFLISLLAIFTTTPVSAAPNCLRFADHDSINQLFIDGGPGTKVHLCPSKTYRLFGPIIFTAADQELATFGYPTGSERAKIRIEQADLVTAIQGDCRRCARVIIRSLVIDGGRKKWKRVKEQADSTGLVVIGGNEGQVISDCWIRDPRGFTAVHVREGDKLSCKGAVIERNEIGPVGEEYKPEVDGPDPELGPLGRPLADGISMACRDSIIKDNTFYDNTDAAVVLYCSPGTLVHANRITARHLSAMAGILMVDSTPFDGDYTGVVVKGNVIDAASRAIRVGIGIGAAVWSDDTETILKGGSVIQNGIQGQFMGFGIAAVGLDGWTVQDNYDQARHQGKRSDRCFDDPVNPEPMAFMYHKPSIKNSKFQDGFSDHEFQYAVCIDGLDSPADGKGAPPLPHEVKKPDSGRNAKAVAPQKDGADNSKAEETSDEPESAKGATHAEAFNTGSHVMDEILEHSQQRMMEAIEHLARRVDVMANTNRPVSAVSSGAGDDSVLSANAAAALADLQARVATLETRQKSLLETTLAMKNNLNTWDHQISALNDWQYDILLDVQHRLMRYLPSNPLEQLAIPPIPPAPAPDVDRTAGTAPTGTGRIRSLRKVLTNRSRLLANVKIRRADVEPWKPVLRMLFAQAVFVVVVIGIRRWWKSRSSHSKVS